MVERLLSQSSTSRPGALSTVAARSVSSGGAGGGASGIAAAMSSNAGSNPFPMRLSADIN
jgi:hypothetical protein